MSKQYLFTLKWLFFFQICRNAVNLIMELNTYELVKWKDIITAMLVTIHVLSSNMDCIFLGIQNIQIYALGMTQCITWEMICIDTIVIKLTLNTIICEMDEVGRGLSSIACNCLVSNSNPVFWSRKDVFCVDLRTAVGPIPRANKNTLSIICIIQGDANLDQFDPYKRSRVTNQSTLFVFADMNKPLIFTTCKHQTRMFGVEIFGDYPTCNLLADFHST